MAMRDFILINNYSGLGRIGFSRNAIAAVASSSMKEVSGVKLFAPHKNTSGVKVVFTKENKALIQLLVSVNKGLNVAKACEAAQQSVVSAVTMSCDIVPFDVQVKVMRIV